MDQGTTKAIQFPAPSTTDVLTDVLGEGAQRLLAQAVEAEVGAYVDAHAEQFDADGHRLVVRNGHKPERQIQTGIGPVTVRQPRVDDRRVDEQGRRLRFTSSILPPYLRKTKAIEELIPWLYLKGISTGDFNEALAALVGPDAPGLSTSTVVRLKEVWRQDYDAWQQRSLADKHYVYLWVDGALAFWEALRKVFGQTLQQRCWVHKTANVLNYLPKSKQAHAEGMLHAIWKAETKADANQAFDQFVATYQGKYPKAAACLAKDRHVLVTFYDFPAEHWVHLRTTNPIESTFATVRLRTAKTKGSGSRIACLTMVFKLAQCAERHWRTLNGAKLLDDVIRGVQFVDGLRKDAA